MKTKRIKMLTLISGFVLMGLLPSSLNAQRPGRGNGPGAGNDECIAGIPSLTAEQKTAIEDLRTAHFKKAELIRAEIGEKEARMKTLRLAEKEDEKAIDRTIDEITKLRGDLMKEREAHHRQVKSLLTEEQKARYDARVGKGQGRRSGPDNDRPGRQGRGNGYRSGNGGNCPYTR